MAGAISEVRAKFGATAAGFKDTLREMRTEMQEFKTNADKAMQQASKASRGFESSLDTVSKSLKDMGKSSEMKGLQDSLKKVKSELDSTGKVSKESMKEFQKAVTDARGDLQQLGASESEMARIESAINAAEAEMKEFKKESTKTANEAKALGEKYKSGFSEAEGGAKKADKASGNLKGTLMKFGGALVGVAAVGSAFGGIVTGVTDYDDALKQLQASTGKTKKETAILGDSMQNIYNLGMGEDFTDIANAMADVGKATNDTGKALENSTKYAITLRDTMGYDVKESARTAGIMMKQFGIDSEEAYNLMGQGAEAGLDVNDDMLDSFSEYSVYFKTLGFDAEGMWNTFKAGSESGAFNADKVGDSIKELGIRVKDGSKSTAEGFSAIGLDADEMAQKFAKGGESSQKALQQTFKGLADIEDPVKRSAAGVALFGTQFEDLEYETIAALGTVRKEADMSKDTMKNMTDVKFSTIGDAFKMIGRNIQTGVLLPIQEKVMPTINNLINDVKENMPQIKQAFSDAFGVVTDTVVKLGPTFKNVFGILKDVAPIILVPLGLAFGALSLVIAPILNHITGMIKAFTGLEAFKPIVAGLIAAFVTWKSTIILTNAAQKAWAVLTKSHILLTQAWTVAQKLLNTALKSNPIGLVITILVALGAALVVAYKESETFRNIVNAAWEGIKKGWAATANFFTETVPKWVSDMIGWFKGAYDGTIKWFKSLGTKTSEIFNNIVDFFVKWGPVMLAALGGPIGLAVLAVVKNWDAIKKKTTDVFNSVKKFLSGVWDSIKTNVQDATDKILKKIKDIWDEAKKKTESVFNGIKSFLKTIWDGYWTLINGVANRIKTMVKNAWDWIKTKTSEIFNSVKSTLSDIWSKMYTTVKGKADDIKSKISSAWTSAKKSTTDMFNDMKKKVQDSFDDMVKGAKALPGKIGSGIKSMAGKATDGAISMANSLMKSLGKGVNGTIDGINYVLDKVGSKKLSNWKVPKYAKGTKGHKGGPAIVGDGGLPELIQTPDGETYMSPDHSVMVDLPAGTSVLSGEKTRELMKSGVPAYKDGIGDFFSMLGGGTKSLIKKVWDKYIPKLPSVDGAFKDVPKKAVGMMKDKSFNYLKKKIESWFSAEGGGLSSINIKGGAKAWKGQIQKAAAALREPLSSSELNGVIAQIQRESGGNQRIVQSPDVRDINTLNGNPARGLLQYIPQTFASYNVRGFSNIYDGFHQLLAFFNNTNWRRDLPYGRRGWGPTGRKKIQGFFKGARVAEQQLAMISEKGPEYIIPTDGSQRAMDLWNQAGHEIGAFESMSIEEENATFRHIIDLENVPEHIDQDALAEMLSKSINNPKVQRAIDRINQKNNTGVKQTRGRG